MSIVPAQTAVPHWFKPYFIPESAEEVLKIQYNKMSAISNKAKRKQEQEGQKEPEAWPGSPTHLLDRGYTFRSELPGSKHEKGNMTSLAKNSSEVSS